MKDALVNRGQIIYRAEFCDAEDQREENNHGELWR